MMRVLALGDVVGRPARALINSVLRAEVKRLAVDFVVINAENSAGGLGVDSATSTELRLSGADALTLGDHTFSKKEFGKFLDENKAWCVRPANYPEGAPGTGWTIVNKEVVGKGARSVGIVNIMGRTFINMSLDCPFRTIERLLSNQLKTCDSVIVDFHAEASSEKCAMAYFLDGKASLVFGTHTHIPTADEQILPQGTGFQSDLGMCGALKSVIGMDADVAVKRFYSGMPQGYRLAEDGPILLQGLIADIEGRKTTRIERYRYSS